MSEKRTLKESHEVIERITKEIKGLLGVAALDVQDAYGDDTLVETFMVRDENYAGGSHRDLPIAGRFAEMLVARLLYTPEIVLDWIGADVEVGRQL